MNRAMTPTYKIAVAAGADAANERMSEQGRTTWDIEDHALACSIVENLMGVAEADEPDMIVYTKPY